MIIVKKWIFNFIIPSTFISHTFKFLILNLVWIQTFWLLGRISGQLGTDIYLMNVNFVYNWMLLLSYFRPVGYSPHSRCKFQLWDICWYSGLTGNSTCRCYQNSHAALPNEISVDWSGSDNHLQRLWAAWLLPRRCAPGPPQDSDGSHGVDSLWRDDGQDGTEILTARALTKDGICCPAWFLPGLLHPPILEYDEVLFGKPGRCVSLLPSWSRE